MRERVLLAATLCLIAVAACSASRQAKPDLPAPEYEPARALPAASAAASAAEQSPEKAPDEDLAGARGGSSVGGAEGGEPPKPGVAADKGIHDDKYEVPAKPVGKETTADRKRSDKPQPAASPEAPPSPTMIPAPPATAPAR